MFVQRYSERSPLGSLSFVFHLSCCVEDALDAVEFLCGRQWKKLCLRMGTKIQSSAFLRDHYPLIYLGGSTGENKKAGNDHNPGLFISPVHKNGYDMDKMRNTILEQESIFRHQVQQLHQLYRRQHELMNEIQRKEADRNGSGSWLSSFAPPSLNSEPRSSNINLTSKGTFDLEILATRSKSFTSSVPATSQIKDDALELNLLHLNRRRTNGFTVGSLGGFNSGEEHLSDNHADKRIFAEHSTMGGLFSGKSMTFAYEPRTELFKNPMFATGSSSAAAVSRTKKKIFGVEIFEGNGDSSSNITSSLNQTLGHCNERSDISSLAQKHNDVPAQGGLPWFLRDSRHKIDPSNATKNSYFMNLDSLQNSSPNFFRKTEIFNSMQSSKQRIKIPAVEAIPISDVQQSFKDLSSAGNTSKTKDGEPDSRQYIDLNLSLIEENDLSPPCLPTAIVRTSTREIDFEASSAITNHSDANESSKEYKSSSEETDKIAADALIAISSYSVENSKTITKDNDAGEEPLESCLEWFAEIVSSCYDDKEEESIPRGMDYFEYTTLNLEDAKDMNYLYNPTLSSLLVHEKPNDDEKDNNDITSSTKRSRRRGSRQQRKDFQRDVLPGLVTLSRLEVTEDLQAFEELNNAECITKSGFSRNNCTRNGKVRKVVRSVRTQRFDDQVEEEAQQRRSLASWGKRTRRLPRQRCSDGILSFAVKC